MEFRKQEGDRSASRGILGVQTVRQLKRCNGLLPQLYCSADWKTCASARPQAIAIWACVCDAGLILCSLELLHGQRRHCALDRSLRLSSMDPCTVSLTLSIRAPRPKRTPSM